MSKTCKKLLAAVLVAAMLVSTLVSGLAVSAATTLGKLTIENTTFADGDTVEVKFTVDFEGKSVNALHMLATIDTDLAITDAKLGTVEYEKDYEDSGIPGLSTPALNISATNLTNGKALFESGVSGDVLVNSFDFTVTFEGAEVDADNTFAITLELTDYDEEDYTPLTGSANITINAKHECVAGTPVDNGDGTHNVPCADETCDKFVEENVAHTYVDGFCACGAEEPKPEIERFTFVGSNVTLGNALNMNFAFKKADVTGTDNYAVITKTYADGRDSVVKTIEQVNWSTSGTAYWLLPSDGIPAKEMGDNIEVVVYNAKGQAISETKIDSVLAYVSRNIDSNIYSTDVKKQKTGTLMADLIAYGAASQVQLKYDAANPVDARLTQLLGSDDWTNYTTKTVEYTNNRTTGDMYVGTNISLLDSIVMNYAYKVTDAVAYAEISYVGWNGVAKNTRVDKADFITNGSYKLIKIDTMVVGDCFEDVTVKLYDAEGNVLSTVVDSVASYCARDTTGNATYVAIMKFVASSYAYLTRNN